MQWTQALEIAAAWKSSFLANKNRNFYVIPKTAKQSGSRQIEAFFLISGETSELPAEISNASQPLLC